MSAVSAAPVRAGPRAVERILAAGRPTLIVFESRRCAPCESLAPVLDALAREFAERVTVVRVDARQAWLAARHHLSFVPTLVFYDRGPSRRASRVTPGRKRSAPTSASSSPAGSVRSPRKARATRSSSASRLRERVRARP